MSRTDKTRPYRVKQAELPPGAYTNWRPEFGCGQSCPTCGVPESVRRENRRTGKAECRDWQREYA